MLTLKLKFYSNENAILYHVRFFELEKAGFQNFNQLVIRLNRPLFQDPGLSGTDPVPPGPQRTEPEREQLRSSGIYLQR